jgi:hypothetical protein
LSSKIFLLFLFFLSKSPTGKYEEKFPIISLFLLTFIYILYLSSSYPFSIFKSKI